MSTSHDRTNTTEDEDQQELYDEKQQELDDEKQQELDDEKQQELADEKQQEREDYARWAGRARIAVRAVVVCPTFGQAVAVDHVCLRCGGFAHRLAGTESLPR